MRTYWVYTSIESDVKNTLWDPLHIISLQWYVYLFKYKFINAIAIIDVILLVCFKYYGWNNKRHSDNKGCLQFRLFQFALSICMLYTFLYKLSNWCIWISTVKNIEISYFWYTNTWSIFNFQFICKYFNKLLNFEIFFNIRVNSYYQWKNNCVFEHFIQTVQCSANHILVRNDIEHWIWLALPKCSTTVYFYKLYTEGTSFGWKVYIQIIINCFFDYSYFIMNQQSKLCFFLFFIYLCSKLVIPQWCCGATWIIMNWSPSDDSHIHMFMHQQNWRISENPFSEIIDGRLSLAFYQLW